MSEKVKEILETKPYKIYTRAEGERALRHLNVLCIELTKNLEIKERGVICRKILVIRGARREYAEGMQGKLKI